MLSSIAYADQLLCRAGTMSDALTLVLRVFEIFSINLVLSVDNAIVIGLACQDLKDDQRQLGIVLGTLAAILLRIAFTLIVSQLLTILFLKFLGGLMVVFIAAKLPFDHNDRPEIKRQRTLIKAIGAVVVADAILSLDNALALGAAADGSWLLITLGLLTSAPIIMFGATLLASLMRRQPLVIWVGALMLGWAGGELIAGDPAWQRLGLIAPPTRLTGALGSALVLVAALTTKRLRQA